MKTKKIIQSILILILSSSFALTSCAKKDKDPEPEDTEQESSLDNNLVENAMNDIEAMVGQVADGGTLITYRKNEQNFTSISGVLASSPCATITGIGTSTVTINFGTNGCLGKDGRTRTGILVFDFSSSNPVTAIHYRNPGFRLIISSQNYAVDGYQVNINSKTITNSSPAIIASGVNLTWSITASVSVIKPNSGGTISWTCNRTKELINTSDPNCYQGQGLAIDWTKAQIKINGSSQGVNSKGENFSCVATNLIRYFTCAPDPNRPHRHPFISGTLSYTPGNRYTRLVDFGNVNSCDFSATLTIKGQTKTITLP